MTGERAVGARRELCLEPAHSSAAKESAVALSGDGDLTELHVAIAGQNGVQPFRALLECARSSMREIPRDIGIGVNTRVKGQVVTRDPAQEQALGLDAVVGMEKRHGPNFMNR
jgi:hypothetical protein